MDNFKYFGCYAICQKGRIVAVEDLDEPEIGVEGIPGSLQTLAWCSDCVCWMDHKRKMFKCPSCGQRATDSDVLDAIQDENLRYYSE